MKKLSLFLLLALLISSVLLLPSCSNAENEATADLSEHLQYTLSPDGESYSVGVFTLEMTMMYPTAEAFREQNADILAIESLTIPSEYKGKPVTSILDSGFYMCSITELRLPSSITSIGDMAFRSCESLTSVSLSKNLAYIGESAFLNCTSLESVIIPSSVEYIGNQAFLGCDSLSGAYYEGSANSWNGIEVRSGNLPMTSVLCYYSNTAPYDTSATYWHYTSDGSVAVWSTDK